MTRKALNALVIGAAALAGVASASSAFAATTLTYDFTTGTRNDTTITSLSYSVGGVNVTAYAYHFNDNAASTVGTVAAAQLGNYVPDGLGVRFGSDPSDAPKSGNDTTGTHQIDNVGGGVDFIALQFDQAVTLTQIGRTSFDLTGVGTRDDDAAILGFTSAAAYGSLNLVGQTYTYSDFTSISGSGAGSNGGTDTGTVSGQSAANVYLVAASLLSDRDDGFKLNGIKVSYTPSVTPPPATVPEPASWAMMIVGFGAIGTSIRRSRRITVRAVAA